MGSVRPCRFAPEPAPKKKGPEINRELLCPSPGVGGEGNRETPFIERRCFQISKLNAPVVYPIVYVLSNTKFSGKATLFIHNMHIFGSRPQKGSRLFIFCLILAAASKNYRSAWTGKTGRRIRPRATSDRAAIHVRLGARQPLQHSGALKRSWKERKP